MEYSQPLVSGVRVTQHKTYGTVCNAYAMLKTHEVVRNGSPPGHGHDVYCSAGRSITQPNVAVLNTRVRKQGMVFLKLSAVHRYGIGGGCAVKDQSYQKPVERCLTVLPNMCPGFRFQHYEICCSHV